VYGGKFDYERNKEAAIALGAEIEKAVVSTSTTAKVNNLLLNYTEASQVVAA
jgi:hypothetical protein